MKEEKCPECGGKGLEIVYGLPAPELFERAERGEVVLGGCCVSSFDPRWQCADCGKTWGAEAERV